MFLLLLLVMVTVAAVVCTLKTGPLARAGASMNGYVSINMCVPPRRPQIAGHPRVHKAFGVDTRVFHPLPSPDCEGKGASEGGLGTWDVLFVGMFVAYKRPWLLAHKTGSRLAVGRLDLAPDMLVGVSKRALVVSHLRSAFVWEVLFCLKVRSHSIRFTGAQGVPKYKMRLGRGKDGRVGIGLLGATYCIPGRCRHLVVAPTCTVGWIVLCLVSLQDFQADSDQIVAHLRDAGVTVAPPVQFTSLNRLYNCARAVYIPCPVEGGGERAVRLVGSGCQGVLCGVLGEGGVVVGILIVGYKPHIHE